MWWLILCGIVIPLVMIVLGLIFMKKPPKNINNTAGYRTETSMKSKEAWTYANKLAGKVFLINGIILFILSFVLMLLIRNRSLDTQGLILILLCLLQTSIIVISILPIERILKSRLDGSKNKEK